MIDYANDKNYDKNCDKNDKNYDIIKIGEIGHHACQVPILLAISCHNHFTQESIFGYLYFLLCFFLDLVLTTFLLLVAVSLLSSTF